MVPGRAGHRRGGATKVELGGAIRPAMAHRRDRRGSSWILLHHEFGHLVVGSVHGQRCDGFYVEPTRRARCRRDAGRAEDVVSATGPRRGNERQAGVSDHPPRSLDPTTGCRGLFVRSTRRRAQVGLAPDPGPHRSPPRRALRPLEFDSPTVPPADLDSTRTHGARALMFLHRVMNSNRGSSIFSTQTTSPQVENDPHRVPLMRSPSCMIQVPHRKYAHPAGNYAALAA